ncbi:hypothetical protein J5868_03285 [Candidatus Saccharibacteria bacterium]|nr:hypothetical protein [Candidatus Saccharibacteria bacterium]
MRIERNKVIAGSLITITTLSTALLTLPSVLADDGFVDVISIDVPVSCSLSSSGMTSHNKTIQNGSTENEIGTTNIKVTCNDNTGYALYAIGYTNDEYGNNKLTSTTLGSTHDIITSTTITTGTSSWAMKLANTGSTYLPIIAGSTDDTNKQTGDPDFSGYTEVPNEYTKVAYFPSSTDIGSGASGSNLTTTYRAYISQTQPAGTYIGQVKYTLVHPSTAGKPVTPLKASDCPAGYVCYAPNASDIEGSMSSLGSISSSPTAGKISVGTSATTINLIAPNYKREGYGFAGWSTDFTATNASTIYGPNETLTVPSTTLATKGMILYPVWVASTGNLQGTNNQGWTGCSSLTTAPSDGTRATLASMTALTDTRDGNVYTVARLADGKCWMTENLRLNSENSVGAENIAKAQGYGDATNATQGNLGKFIGLANSEDANFTSNTTANSLYSIDGSNGTININSNSNYYPGYRMPRYNKNNTNMATNATNSDNTTTLTDSYNANNNHVRWYGYGNYYTWPAAIADTAYYGQNNTSVTTTSICPTGWRLPIGGQTTVNTTGDFYVLTKTLMGGTEPNTNNTNGYGYYQGIVDNVDLGATASKVLRAYPTNVVYSGYFNGSSAYNRGSRGYYWSSSVNSNLYAYTLNLDSSSVSPGTNSFTKNLGFSVRCIAQ